jgi:hypothetical protein
MAMFYQEPNPTNDPNYLGSSKEPDRVQADTSLGSLFENIGGVANKVGPAVENIFKEHIKDDAHKLIDPVMAEHGTGMSLEEVQGVAGTGAKGRVRALQMNQGAPTYDDGAGGGNWETGTGAEGGDGPGGSIFQPEAKPLPQGAQQQIGGLQRLNKAYAAGNLSDSYYNAQLLATTKQLRAQYPGFRDEVDQAVSSITGVQPANALRASLQRDIQYNQAAAMANANNDQKFREKYLPEIGALGLDAQNTPIEVLRPAVQEYVGNRELLKAQQLKAEVGSPQAEAALSDSIARVVQQSIVAEGNRATKGMTVTDFDKQAATLAARGADPKEVDALVNQMTIRRGQLEQEIRQMAYKPLEGDKEGHSLVSKTKDGDTKLAAIIQAQLKPYDDRIALAKSGNFSALERVTNMNKYQSQTDMQRLTTAFPQARVAAAINNSFPNNPLMVNQFMEKSTILGDFGNAVKTGLGNAIINGTPSTPAPTPSQATTFYPKDVPTSAVYRETMKQYDRVISPENKNFENAAHVAGQFFGDQKFYDDLNDSGRLKLFMTMAHPDKTKYIKSLGEETFQKYQQWAQYAAGDIWRRNSDDLQSMITTKGIDLRFNPTTLQFEYTPPKTNGETGIPTASNGQQLQQKVQSINNAITMLRPIVGDNGPKIMNALGIDPSAAKEDGLIDRISKAVQGKWEDWTTEGEREAIKSGTAPAKAPTPGKQSMNELPAAALREVTAQAESGGDYNAVFGMGRNSSRDLSGHTVGEIMAMQKHYTDSGSPSSAVGKYQFLRKTLASLVKEGAIAADEPFTADVQERAFTALANRRGMGKYLSGQMDENSFMNSLAQEWAGLPTTNGMSFYQGDGLNKATVTPKAVKDALARLRQEG